LRFPIAVPNSNVHTEKIMSFFYDSELDLLKSSTSSNPFLSSTTAPLFLQTSDPEVDCLDLDQYSSLVDFQEVSMNLEEMIEGVTDLLPNYLDQPQVKAEQHQYEAEDNQSYPECHTLPDMAYLSASSPLSSCSTSRPNSSGGNKRKRLDKDSPEYKRRRMMNNLAVKKSREKAKAESRKVEEKVGILTTENEVLQKRVEQLSEEIKFLRGFFSNIKGLPENIQHQISKTLGGNS